MVQKCKEMSLAERIFAGWQETLVWSCLQGVMGAVYTQGKDSALAVIGDFCFFAGKPNLELALFLPPETKGTERILIPQDSAWAALLESAYPGQAQKTLRYAFAKGGEHFDREALEAWSRQLPTGVSLREIDQRLYEKCLENSWSEDLVSLFSSPWRYTQEGLGVAAVQGEELLAGASSYSVYRGGIEIEVDTREDWRRRGLARACCAKLILLCLERGLRPSWDAANPASAALAEQLGFRPAGAYPAYLIREQRIQYRALSAEEISLALFSQFVRRQEVTHCWRKMDGVWQILPIAFVDDWSPEEYAFLVDCLANTLATGGAVFGAFRDGKLKGFASLEGKRLGSRGQYIDLSSIHVSQDCRRQGIGKTLFSLAKEWAKNHGGEKLYISAHSCVNSQAFYKTMGCVEAAEYNREHAEKEPCDCQLECSV